MSHQLRGQEAPALSEEMVPSSPFITDCHRNAVEILTRAFEESRPLSILIGDGKSGASFVISRFLGGLAGDVVVARITEPCSDAIDGMREVVRGIGFDPKDMNLADLEHVLKMFLIFQRTHKRRTIICFEEAQDNGQWVLDKVCRFVEMETRSKFGSMVILSGRPSLNELLDEPPLNAACVRAAKRISLAPFTLAETKEYIRRRIEGAGAADVGQVFDFDAVAAIQEISEGIPDVVRNLCSQCLELADLGDTAPVTIALVNRAAKLLRLAAIVQEPNVTVEPAEADQEVLSKGRLVAYKNDLFDQEQALDGRHILIGRDRQCDLSLRSITVSRHHALVVNSSLGVKILDLGSKNGTFVNGRRIRKYTLLNSDRITIGDRSIEFIAGEDQQSWFFADEPTETFEPYMFDVGQPENGNGDARPMLNGTRTMRIQRAST
jgi:type II secretory pathway predicted ATPase ExeA